MLSALVVGVVFGFGCLGRTVADAPARLTATLTNPAADAISPTFTADDTPETIEEKTRRAVATIKAKGEVRAAARKSEAEDDFYATAKTVTGWILAGLALTAVGCFVGSLIPWGRALGLDAGDATKAFAGVAVVVATRYALLRWGVMAANIGFWVVIVLAIIAAAATLWPIAAGVLRRRATSVAPRPPGVDA